MTGTPNNNNNAIPATPEISRHLYTLHEDEPSATTTEEQACASDEFHTRIARLIHQVLPNYTLADLDTTLKDFLSPMQVANESGLSVLDESDLPPKDTTTNAHWKNPAFRKTFMTIVKASVEYRFLPSTSFHLLNRWTKNIGLPNNGTPSSISVTSGSSSVKEEKYKIDACTKVTLEPFSGLSVDYKKWDEHVCMSYGVAGLNEFLSDPNLCTQHNDISRSIRYNLCKALKEGHFSYLVDEHPNETNAAKFYEIIKKEADETSDQRIREFKAWWHLFTHSLDSPKSYNSFIDRYKQSLTILKESKSKGVEDDILLRALLLRAIQCDEYEDVKKDITKDLDMKPDEILVALKKHHHAMGTEESFNDIASPSTIKSKSRVIRRGKTDEKKSDSKWREPFIPAWPSGLIDVCTNSLWSQLSNWKSLVNKSNKNSNERQRLKDFKITVPNSGDDSSRSSHKRDRDNRDRGYSHNGDGSKMRSSKSNRYSTDRRRHSRRSGRRSRSNSPDSLSDVSQDTNRSDKSNTPSHTSKKIRRSARRDDNRSPSPPVRDRSGSKVLGGILNRR